MSSIVSSLHGSESSSQGPKNSVFLVGERYLDTPEGVNYMTLYYYSGRSQCVISNQEVY